MTKKENQLNKNNNFNSLYITILIILCSSLIILTNYVSTRNLAKSFQEQVMQIEYNKIGGKENYELVKQLQKNEILNYINTLREEKPELIESIEKEIKAKKNNHNFLNDKEIDSLKENSYFMGNSGATISIIGFSDLECEHCIEASKTNLIENIFEKYGDSINYTFKNFPLNYHKNSEIEAIATICIKNLSKDKQNYFEFIKKVFSNSKGGGEGIELSKLTQFAGELGVNEEDFESCLENETYKEEVTKEFNQGRDLKIDSVPSIVILNNQTGEYILIKEKVNYDEFVNKIEELK